jgi:pilus assembly protein Flp/PilA
MAHGPKDFPALGLMLKRFATDDRGATAIEYAMIAAGVGAAIAATVYRLGETIETTLYNKIDGAIQ